LRQLEEICTEETFRPGAHICKQNRLQDKIYIIETGLAAVCVELGPLSYRQIQSIGKYDIFGWSAMIEPFKCTSTVKAIKTIKALSLSGKDLYNFCTDNPETGLIITRALVRIIRGRLQDAFTQLVGVACDT
jgi:CRP/FNR family cyclic AMP-dependent transcriptional regulator